MHRLLVLGSVVASALVLQQEATGAQFNVANVCQPVTNTDSGRIKFVRNRVVNTSTNNTAKVTCALGSGNASTPFNIAVLDVNSDAGKAVVCDGYVYAGGISLFLETQTSVNSANPQTLTFDGGPNASAALHVECTLPVAKGASDSQMSSVEVVGF